MAVLFSAFFSPLIPVTGNKAVTNIFFKEDFTVIMWIITNLRLQKCRLNIKKGWENFQYTHVRKLNILICYTCNFHVLGRILNQIRLVHYTKLDTADSH